MNATASPIENASLFESYLSEKIDSKSPVCLIVSTPFGSVSLHGELSYCSDSESYLVLSSDSVSSGYFGLQDVDRVDGICIWLKCRW